MILLEPQSSLSPLAPFLPLIHSQHLLLILSQNSNLWESTVLSYSPIIPLFCLPFPAHPSWIFLLFLDWLPCHFYRSSPKNNNGFHYREVSYHAFSKDFAEDFLRFRAFASYSARMHSYQLNLGFGSFHIMLFLPCICTINNMHYVSL